MMVLVLLLLATVACATAVVRLVLVDGLGWRPAPPSRAEQQEVRTWPR